MLTINEIKNMGICGDCLDVMRSMPDYSIDTIITDPPYGLKFMGKKWDYEIPSVDHFTEMLRVAKPGAILLCFGGSRTWHRIAVHIEDAGWQIRDTIFWLYGSGFPKSLDIGKDFDRRACMEKLETELGRHPTKKEWDAAWKNFRKPLRRNQNSRENCTKKNTLYESGMVGKTDYVSAPTTELAKVWDGWGTGLKPACEPIILAMKHLDGTFIETAEKWGVAGMNIDGCRIPTDDKSLYRPSVNNCDRESGRFQKQKSKIIGSMDNKCQLGRWPANVILDEVAAAMLDEQSGSLKSGDNNTRRKEGRFLEHGGLGKDGDTQTAYGDSGGASRFFYTAKADKTQRDEGLEGMKKGMKKGMNTSPRDYDNQVHGEIAIRNFHPTVKPLDLMIYLCRLTKTPTGGIVLDPYAGSGTTLRAAEAVGRPFVGIEIDPEYCEIARRRVAFEQDKLALFAGKRN